MTVVSWSTTKTWMGPSITVSQSASHEPTAALGNILCVPEHYMKFMHYALSNRLIAYIQYQRRRHQTVTSNKRLPSVCNEWHLTSDAGIMFCHQCWWCWRFQRKTRNCSFPMQLSIICWLPKLAINHKNFENPALSSVQKMKQFWNCWKVLHRW